jgi:hypothetical protein
MACVVLGDQSAPTWADYLSLLPKVIKHTSRNN